MTNATNAVTLTKEEKLARIDEQIAKLQQRRYNIENDIVVPAKQPKVVALPEVGATIDFKFGRTTATSAPVVRSGVVLAVKPSADLGEGKKSPAQVKVQCGEGFDAELLVIYPAQIVTAAVAE